MTTTPTQHEAERLAEQIDAIAVRIDYDTTGRYGSDEVKPILEAATYLRRHPALEAENAVLTAERDALRFDYQRLKARLAELEAQRVPLSGEQIKSLSCGCYDGGCTDPLILFARAIEAAHGITPKGQV